MADEYIRKADVLNLPQSIERNLCGEIVERSIDVKDVEALKPADVVPVVHGEWLPTNDDNKKRCNKCDTIVLIAMYPTGNANYCPNCGVKMDAEGEE